MLKSFAFTCLLVLYCIVSRAQVNQTTGSATYSVPVFSWQDNKSSLQSMVAMSYSSGNGIKTNDIASNLGLNWNLIAGGVITRIQAGEPDDQYPYAGTNGLYRFPAGILYASTPAVNGCPAALTQYPIFKSTDQLYSQHNSTAEDRQMDYFSFQFNDKAGMFALDPNDIGKAWSLGDSKMKITFQTADLQSLGVRTRISGFTIQDEDGLKYKFTTYGMAKVLQSGYCDRDLKVNQHSHKMSGGNVYHMTDFEDPNFVRPWVINSWYLTEVEDPLTGRKIQFTYNQRNTNMLAGVQITYNVPKDYAVIAHSRSITKSQDIAGITYPDGHTVNFNYGAARADVAGTYRLASIDVLYQGRALSKHVLNTSYFILNRYGNPTTDYEKKVARLCLLGVQKIGVDLKEETQAYKFDYYTGTGGDDVVPPAFSYIKDIWGYYNGSSSVGYNNESISLTAELNSLSLAQVRGLCFSHTGVTGPYLNPKAGYAKNGLLRQVIFPTGGTLTFEYAQNRGVLGVSEVNVGGVHVSKTSVTDGGTTTSCANPITTNYDYVVDGAGSASSLWGLEMPVNEVNSATHYAPADKRYKWKPASIFGYCAWKYSHPGILAQQETLDMTGFAKAMQALEPYLGILSLASTINDVATLIGAASPGFGTIVAVVLDVVSGLVTLFVTCFGDQSRDYTNKVLYNSDLNSIAPLPTQFKRVVATESSGGIGKTVQEFTSSDDYAVWVTANPHFIPLQRYAPWAYGLPKKTTVYDVNGFKVKEIENTYDFDRAKYSISPCYDVHGNCNLVGVTSHIVACKCSPIKYSSQRSSQWDDPGIYDDPSSYKTSSYSDMNVDFYGQYTGRVQLSESRERTYRKNDNSNFVETKKVFYYNSINYQVSSIISTKSNGDMIVESTRYSTDFSGGIFSTMADNNIVNVPVVKEINKSSSPSGLLSEVVTEYAQMANGAIVPSRTLVQRFEKPSLTYHSYTGPADPAIATTYVVANSMAYSSASNLATLTDEGGRKVASIYDYDDKYAVATIVNCDYATDKPAYSSFETNTTGNWVILGSSHSFNISAAVTGEQSLMLNGDLIETVYHAAKDYKLSYWATSGPLTISGPTAVLVKTGPTNNGFTYYEYDIAAGHSVLFLSGSGSIDELRLYPKDARMTTATYDPAIGKTSECDQNNRIVYYEYDNLSRLRLVRDENHNIVKMLEYNSVSPSKMNGCPGLYYNKAISEIFFKSDCGTGYTPDQVVYTVGANTFSSAISQADADAQAENYLLENGQGYADANGSCLLEYYNAARSADFTTESCDDGYVGGTVTYTVPAGRYMSLISQADADQMAADDVAANGANYANTVSPSCTINYDPDWEWAPGDPSYCLSVDGNLPPHLFGLVTDMNYHSPTFGQTQWVDLGPQEECASNMYYNSPQSASFTRNDCGSGYVGTPVTYTVPPGTYSSAVSQAAADQLALDDIAANGQSYANSHGSCQPPCDEVSCPGPDKKCVNGVCETGVQVITISYRIRISGVWNYYCNYVYCFSDGSSSDEIEAPSGALCPTSSCP